MKNKKIIRLFTAALAVALCATAFAVPAFAGGGDGEPYYTETAEPEVTEEPQEETTGVWSRRSAPDPGGQRHPGGRFLRRQAAHHGHHQGGQLFLHPDRPGKRGCGDRRSFPKPGGRGRPYGPDGGWRGPGDAGGLHLYGEMPGRGNEHLLRGVRGEYG
mgnify:CR=1 FL=1